VAAELAQELDVEALDIPAIGDVDTSADHFDDPAAGGEGTGHWSRVPWGGRDERPPFARRVAHRARMVPFYARHPRQLADRTRRALGMRGSLFELPEPTHRVRHGQPVELSGREWVSVHTPGHTVDHLCLFDPEHGILVSGDHVLPTITPHVAGVGVGMDSLKSYLRTLDVVASLDGVRLALPAHGHPFDDVPGRVDAIKEHHAERMEHLRTASIALGPSTVPQLCHEIFPERHWGPMAESETFAHLEHLVGEDLADRTRASDGALLYQAR
jgi:glyoxylase-like metal-dependent hydrolase (beta-lactamase superfamily II)